MFKVNRMRNVEISNETFDSKSFQFPKEGQISYHPSSIVHIKLLIAPQGAHRIYDDFDEGFITKNEDGSYIVSMSLPREWACDYILSFGIYAEVLEPESIREELLLQAEKIKNIYLKT